MALGILEVSIFDLMKLLAYGSGCKTILFLPGFGKDNYWETSEHGKHLGLLTQLGSKANVLVAEITHSPSPRVVRSSWHYFLQRRFSCWLTPMEPSTL
jgi:hypothetical protein